MERSKEMKRTFDIQVRPKMRLSEIERILKDNRAIVPVPSRQTLIRMCESGVLETPTGKPGRSGWLVYEDSFLKWLKSLDENG